MLGYPTDRTAHGVVSIVLAVAPPLEFLALGSSLFGYRMAAWSYALWAGVLLALGGLLIWRSRWRVIVAARRLLLRPGWMRREIVEIPLAAIADARHDPATGRLVVTADGAEYGVPCRTGPAAAILDALREAGATAA